jgi:hypothetical protein
MIFLFSLYFLSRFLNLFSLPIFNDEAIYLHWGQIMTQTPNHFYSLFDGKPPLFLWLLGIIQNLPLDPLLSGRGVSIIFGALTLLGIVKICQLLKFSSRTQIIAGLLYITSPLLLFFDRMAILDSPVSAILIWVLYFCIQISQSSIINRKSSISLGLIQGTGLWLKGTSQLFLYLPFIIPLLTWLIDKNKKKAKQEFFIFLGSYFLAQILFLPIRLQPLFSQYSKREGDFLLPISDIFNSTAWFSNLQTGILTLLIFLTPIVVFMAVRGFIKIYQETPKTALIILSFSTIPFIFEIFTARYFLSRYYLFTFLPIILLASYAFENISKNFKLWLLLVLILPFFLSLSTIINPLITLKTIGFNSLLKTDFWQYISGWPSGYGVKEAADWLNNESQKQPIVVVTRADSGNPEDAMFVYLSKNKSILLTQTSRQPTAEEIAPLKNIPIYFVSRGTQLLNMEKSLTKKMIFNKPLGGKFVGIYELKIAP